MKLIGRENEVAELNRLYESNKCEFVAIYGRKGVGKTFLVEEALGDKLVFKHTGISDDELRLLGAKRKTQYQLKAFYESLRLYGYKEKDKPKTWLEAFSMLIRLLKERKGEGRIAVFIDELPWLDTSKSDFFPAFSWFWNSWACSNHEVMLLVCGSSMSWMYDKLINARGGMFDRLTYSIKLSPLSLGECEQFLREKKMEPSRYEIAKIYMAFGGIPYYLRYLEPSDSFSSFVDRMFFSKGAKLVDEFDNLFAASFEETALSLRIVKAFSKRARGYSRKELLDALGIKDGKYFSNALRGLENSDFILKYVPFKGNGKERYYKVIDPFCYFYLKHIENNVSLNPDVFTYLNGSSWLGAAFENLCFCHLPSIRAKLGISGVKTMQFSYLMKAEAENESGAQMDLIIERKDGIVNLCEMKFYKEEYTQDKKEHLNLENKISKISKLIAKSQSIQPVLITTFGLKNGGYFSDYVMAITLDDLLS